MTPAERETALQQALEGELDAQGLPADLREEVAATAQVVTALRALPEAEPPADFHVRLVRRLRLAAAVGPAMGAPPGEAGERPGEALSQGVGGVSPASGVEVRPAGPGSRRPAGPRRGAVLPWPVRARHLLPWAGGAVAAVLVLAVVAAGYGLLGARHPHSGASAAVASLARPQLAVAPAHGAVATNAPFAAARAGTGGATAAGSAKGASLTSAAAAAPAASATAPVAVGQRKIVETASLTVRVADIGTAFERVDTLTAATRGYVASSDLYHVGGALHARLTARVPSRDLATFTQKVGALGTVTAQSQGSSDVTQRYIDTTGRLQALKAERTAYLALLHKAGNVADALKVQQALSAVEGQIETLTTEIQSLNDLTSLATVNVTLTPLAAGPTVAGDGGPIGVRLGAALAGSWRALVAFAAAAVVAVVWAVPWLVLLAVIGAVVVVVVRLRRRGRRQPAA